MKAAFIAADRRTKIRITVGAGVGAGTGLFFGIAMIGIAQAANEPWVGSFVDVIIYLIAGIVTGIVFGAYAKPTYKAFEGGILGGFITLGFKGVTVLLGVGGEM